ncbi:MAG: hypothetical protein ACOCXH_15695 [Cyclobacteriaceae bacterium]
MIKYKITFFCLAFILILVWCCSTDGDELIDIDVQENTLGPAPNQRKPGSFKYNNSSFDAQAQSTTCSPHYKDDNTYYLTMKSTVIYQGEVAKGVVYIIIPRDNIKSMEYDIITSESLDLTGKSNNAIISFYMNTLMANFHVEGYASGGKLWVNTEDGNIVARFENISLKANKDGSGSEVGKLSGAIDCSEKHND